jgi:hypothetical protein
VRGAQTLGDAFRASFVPEDATLRQAPANVLFQAEMAAEQMERRSLYMGLSQQMTDRAIRRGFEMVGVAEEWCETPIEKRILPWLIFADYGDKFLSVPAGAHSPRNQDMMPEDDILVVPQFAFAKYRMDFAIIARANGRMHIVCVECDGADFHTEAYDGARDLYLRGYGIPTVRLTGKEILAYPGGAIARVVDAVRALVEG